MNPTTDPQPLQPPRTSFSCDRHPHENFSGFCPLCLCERLTTLDQSAAASSTIKSPFNSGKTELRRSKSFSAAKYDGSGLVSGGSCEPQRKSCDVRERTSSTQFHQANSGNEEADAINEQLKTMQDHINLDLHPKKHSRSNFWSAASVLGQKWQKWRRKPKKNNDVVSSFHLPLDSKSEIADFGRRSVDIDPRFSLDVGRISYDDPRHSWDGYVIGRTFPRLPPMVEDVPVPVPVPVPRSDMQMFVEQVGSDLPGGSIQTREYYTDSSSKRRKSLDRSSSIRKMAAAVVAEMDESGEMKAAVSNAKVSPATVDYSYNHLGLRFSSIGNERELARGSNASSLRDDCSESFELGLRDKKGGNGKKPSRWKWKLWGFSRRSGKDENGVETGINNRLFRSNSSVSCRNSSYNTKKSNSELVLERNRSVKYSPSHTDSGLLRFYLTPLRGSRRSNSNLVSKDDTHHNRNRLTIFG